MRLNLQILSPSVLCTFWLTDGLEELSGLSFLENIFELWFDFFFKEKERKPFLSELQIKLLHPRTIFSNVEGILSSSYSPDLIQGPFANVHAQAWAWNAERWGLLFLWVFSGGYRCPHKASCSLRKRILAVERGICFFCSVGVSSKR